MLSSRDAAAAPSAGQTLKQPAALIAAAAKERQSRAEGSKLDTKAGIRTSTSKPGSITAGSGSQQGSNRSVESPAAGLAMPGDPATGTAKQPLAAAKQLASKPGSDGQEAGEHGSDGLEAGEHSAVGQPAGASQLGPTRLGLSKPGKKGPAGLGPHRLGCSTPGPGKQGAAGRAAGSSKDGVTRQAPTQPDPTKGSAASQGSAAGTQSETAGKPESGKLGIHRRGSSVQGPSVQGGGKPDAAGRRTGASKLGAAGPAAGAGVLGASKPPRHAASGPWRIQPDGGAPRAAAPGAAAAGVAAGQPPPRPAPGAVAAGQPACTTAVPGEVAASQPPLQLHAETVAAVARLLTATAAAAEGGASRGEADRDTRGGPGLYPQGSALWRIRWSQQEGAAAERASADWCAPGRQRLRPGPCIV